MRRAAVALACVGALLGAACGGGGEPPPGRQLAFDSLDGVRLLGDLRGEGEVGIVLAHMFPSDRSSWSEFSSLLAEEGYLTLAFDFRGYGDSEGERDIPEIWRDVVAAARELGDRGAKRVVVIGASMGGTAALVAAAREPGAIDGVITLSAPSTFMGLSAPPEVLAANGAPKLFVAADGDGAAAQAAQDFYQGSSPPKRVEILAGTDHGSDLLEGRHTEVVRRLLLDFLKSVEAAAGVS
jgi:pimeloyl-ACP methyl ester carboxylesterase